MILHIDMDAFYASVEQLDQPRLKGHCVIVGGTSGRGVVSAASYEARAFGVRSAMPIFQARRLCPQGVFVSPRMDRYRQVSREVMDLLQEFCPLVEPVSIDEAFIDLAGTERLHGPPDVLARTIKKKIRHTLHLTCSIGVAPNRFLAKIASDFQKPDGLTVISPEQVREFIDQLPITQVPGVGPKTHAKVEQLGVRFLGDIRKFSASALESLFGSRRVIANAARLGHGGVAVAVADATKGLPVRCEFEAVLVDAPCSGTGTLRRHPEIRWRLAEDDLVPLAARQERILSRAAAIVRPGGVLVYAVCSLEPEEGEGVLRAFLDSHPGFDVEDPRAFFPAAAARYVGEDRALRTSPAGDGLDGFFAVRLVRRAYDTMARRTRTANGDRS